jgi:hypothetical protein
MEVYRRSGKKGEDPETSRLRGEIKRLRQQLDSEKSRADQAQSRADLAEAKLVSLHSSGMVVTSENPQHDNGNPEAIAKYKSQNERLLAELEDARSHIFSLQPYRKDLTPEEVRRVRPLTNTGTLMRYADFVSRTMPISSTTSLSGQRKS